MLIPEVEEHFVDVDGEHSGTQHMQAQPINMNGHAFFRHDGVVPKGVVACQNAAAKEVSDGDGRARNKHTRV